MTDIAPRPVLSHGDWATNGDMIADCARLGYLRDGWLIWDPTYGEGAFWTRWRPTEGQLWCTDVDPSKSPDHQLGYDFVKHQVGNLLRKYDAVVVDGPYKLNGTDQGEGARYGVAGEYCAVDARHALLGAMLDQAAVAVRPGGYVLFKCQDQTNGGRKHWQTRMFADRGEAAGLVHVDSLLFPGYRPQPARSTCQWCGSKVMRRKNGVWGTLSRSAGHDAFTCTGAFLPDTSHVPDPSDIGQDASHTNYSTLLVFQRPIDTEA